MIHLQNLKSKHTVAVISKTVAEIESLIYKAGQQNVRITSGKKNASADAFKEQSKVRESLRQLLPELYSSRVGVVNKMADFLAKIVGQRRPASYEEVVKYLPHSEISQGRIGDCYLLAGINSLKKTHPEIYLSTLSKSLRKGQNSGEWQVRFQGLDLPQMQADLGVGFDGWITVTNRDLKIWAVQGMSADLPDVILERAYASYISRKQRRKAGMTMHRDRKLSMEGGFGHRALHDILGPDVASKQMIADYGSFDGYKSLKENGNAGTASDFLRHTLRTHPERYIVTANSPYKGVLGRFVIIEGRIIYNRHAYSIIKVEGDQVHIENPHNTSKTILLSVDNFVNTFSQISYVELKNI